MTSTGTQFQPFTVLQKMEQPTRVVVLRVRPPGDRGWNTWGGEYLSDVEIADEWRWVAPRIPGDAADLLDHPVILDRPLTNVLEGLDHETFDGYRPDWLIHPGARIADV